MGSKHNIMPTKIELKSIHVNLRMSEETYCFDAKLYYNGKHIANCYNHGHGAATSINPVYNQNPRLNDANRAMVKEAEAFCKTLPPVDGYDMDLEYFVDNAIHMFCKNKEDQRMAKKLQTCMQKGIVYGTPDNFTTVSWKGHSVMSLLASKQGRDAIAKKIQQLKDNGEKVLNTNLPQELL